MGHVRNGVAGLAYYGLLESELVGGGALMSLCHGTRMGWDVTCGSHRPPSHVLVGMKGSAELFSQPVCGVCMYLDIFKVKRIIPSIWRENRWQWLLSRVVFPGTSKMANADLCQQLLLRALARGRAVAVPTAWNGTFLHGFVPLDFSVLLAE